MAAAYASAMSCMHRPSLNLPALKKKGETLPLFKVNFPNNKAPHSFAACSNARWDAVSGLPDPEDAAAILTCCCWCWWRCCSGWGCTCCCCWSCANGWDKSVFAAAAAAEANTKAAAAAISAAVDVLRVQRVNEGREKSLHKPFDALHRMLWPWTVNERHKTTERKAR